MRFLIRTFVVAVFTAFLPTLTASADNDSSSGKLSCELDPANFDFTDGSGVVFGGGTREEADSAYRVLEERLDDLQGFRGGRIFYARGSGDLSTHICVEHRCSAEDLLTGLQRCVASRTGPDGACRPLAVAYEGRLYCLLQPRGEFGVPFVPYDPFRAQRSED